MTSPAAARGRFAAPLLDLSILAAGLLWFYRKYIFFGATINGAGFTDAAVLTQPTSAYTMRRLLAGDLPLWNTSWFAGFPHLAMPHSAVFYPATWVFGCFDFLPAFVAVFTVHVFIFGASVYLLSRDMFGSRLVAVTLALVLMTGRIPTTLLDSGQLWTLQTITWFPLAFFFLRRIWHTDSPLAGLGLASMNALMVLGGDPMSLAFALYFFAFYVVAEICGGLLWRGRSVQITFRKSLCSLAAVVLSVLVCGIQIVPSQEFFAESIRSYGASLEHLRFMSKGFGAQLSAFASDYTAIDSLGVLQNRVLLALSMVAILRVRSGELWGILAAMAFCVLYSQMPEWFYAIVKHVPVYNGVRATRRIAFVVTFGEILLAGYALHRMVSAGATLKARAIDCTLFAGFVLVLFALPLFSKAVIAPWIYVSAAIAAALIALSWIPDARVRRVVPCVICALCIYASMAVNTRQLAEGRPSQFEIHPDVADFARRHEGLGRVELMDHGKNQYGPSIGLLTNLRTLRGNHALQLTRYAEFLRDVGDIRIAQRTPEGRLGELAGTPSALADALTPAGLRVLDLFGVDEIFFSDPAPANLPAIVKSNHFTIERRGSYAVAKNLGAMPPAWSMHSVRTVASKEEAIAALKEPAFDYQNTIVLVGKFDANGWAKPAAPESVTIRTYEPERIVAEANFSAPGMLVFSEVYYPGWKAFVDGKNAMIYPVDTVFRGIALSGGHHMIEMEYRPTILWRGGALTIVGVVLWFGWLWWGRRTRARNTKPASVPA